MAVGFAALWDEEGALGTAMFPVGVGDLLRSFLTSCGLGDCTITFLPPESTAFASLWFGAQLASVLFSSYLL